MRFITVIFAVATFLQARSVMAATGTVAMKGSVLQAASAVQSSQSCVCPCCLSASNYSYKLSKNLF